MVRRGPAVASKMVQHLCWELVVRMSNCDRCFETDGLQCVHFLIVCNLPLGVGLSWPSRCVLHAAGGDRNSLVDPLNISFKDLYRLLYACLCYFLKGIVILWFGATNINVNSMF